MSETAVQLFSRLGAKESLGDVGLPIFSHIPGGLRPSDVVEFSGGEGTGKSELLLNIVAHCTLPKVVGGNSSLGKEMEVVYVCTDHKLDLLRLVTIMEAKISEAWVSSGEAVCTTKVKDTVKTCLSRTHVVHCTSSSELTASLDYLRVTYLRAHPQVAAVMLDNVASFYWIDRSRLGRAADRPSLEPWVRSLRELVRDQHLVLFAAKPLLIGRLEEAPNLKKSCSSDDFMCRQWRPFVKYRFLLQKGGTLQGAHPGTTFRCTPLPPLHVPPPSSCYTFIVKESGVHFVS